MSGVEYDRLVEIVDGWRCREPDCRALRMCEHSGAGTDNVALAVAMDAVLQLHREDEDDPIGECAEDGQDWPCATVVAAFLAVTT